MKAGSRFARQIQIRSAFMFLFTPPPPFLQHVATARYFESIDIVVYCELFERGPLDAICLDSPFIVSVAGGVCRRWRT